MTNTWKGIQSLISLNTATLNVPRVWSFKWYLATIVLFNQKVNRAWLSAPAIVFEPETFQFISSININ